MFVSGIDSVIFTFVYIERFAGGYDLWVYRTFIMVQTDELTTWMNESSDG